MQDVYIEFKPQPKFKPPEQNWVFARRLYKNISVIVQNERKFQRKYAITNNTYTYIFSTLLKILLLQIAQLNQSNFFSFPNNNFRRL